MGLSLSNLNKPMRKSQFGTIDPTGQFGDVAMDASVTAGRGDLGYSQMTGQLQGDRQYLQGLRSGQNSLAAEQLRQGLEQQQGQLAGMAAGARGGQQPGAARTAMMSMGRAGSAMAGNAQMARIAEQNAAAQTLAGLNMGQRGQDIQYSLGQRGLAVQGLSAMEDARTQRYAAEMGVPSRREALVGALSGGLGAFGASK